MNAIESQYDAVILDLDGVITDTASLHARAWKELFDAFLQQRSEQAGSAFEPFDIEQDYRRYVDGRPRYDGVRSFLASRDITLEEGAPDEPPARETICGLGNRKNERFHDLLRAEGPGVYDDAVEQIRRWRAQGLKIAIVSSSRNCKAVLEAAGLEALFDVRVDGATAQHDNLKGKPAPDYFLDAAKKLGVPPSRAIVVEDAISGVQAGRAGAFGLVVGVDRVGQGDALGENGADVVVTALTQLDEQNNHQHSNATNDTVFLPNDWKAVLREALGDRRPVVFLDYDGTLTPIVSQPDQAVLSDAMRDTVRRLAEQCTVAIVSGRDRADVEQRVDLDNIIYAGSHGFDITGPNGLHLEHEGGQACLSDLDAAQQRLQEALSSIEGAMVERKRVAIAIHYRNVHESQIEQVKSAVNAVASEHPKLRKSGGKKIIELQPDIDWNKGRAIMWLLQTLDLDQPDVLPIYIGDDVTDEDAFRALNQRGNGIGLGVGEMPESTASDYHLNDVNDVRDFLESLMKMLTRPATCRNGT